MAAFPDEEYSERLARTRTRMGEAGVDVLLITDPANMNYLSGYDAWSFYVPQAVIVPNKPKPPVWVGRGVGAPKGVFTTTPPREKNLGFPHDYVEAPVQDPTAAVSSGLPATGVSP